MDAEGLKALFEPFGSVTVKRMFGGAGIYAEGLCFALEADGEVFLKTDSLSQPSFSAADSAPFTYVAKGKSRPTSYWSLPTAAHEDDDELRRWAGMDWMRRDARLRPGGSRSGNPRRARKARRGRSSLQSSGQTLAGIVIARLALEANRNRHREPARRGDPGEWSAPCGSWIAASAFGLLAMTNSGRIRARQPSLVMPANAGIQSGTHDPLDSRVRGNDSTADFDSLMKLGSPRPAA